LVSPYKGEKNTKPPLSPSFKEGKNNSNEINPSPERVAKQRSGASGARVDECDHRSIEYDHQEYSKLTLERLGGVMRLN
jgi:hypothetical protein